jgi:hypothetical protein
MCTLLWIYLLDKIKLQRGILCEIVIIVFSILALIQAVLLDGYLWRKLFN